MLPLKPTIRCSSLTQHQNGFKAPRVALAKQKHFNRNYSIGLSTENTTANHSSKSVTMQAMLGSQGFMTSSTEEFQLKNDEVASSFAWAMPKEEIGALRFLKVSTFNAASQNPQPKSEHACSAYKHASMHASMKPHGPCMRHVTGCPAGGYTS